MTWDPYDPPDALETRHDRRPAGPPPVSGRVVAAVLGGMALLALVFTVAANAQEATNQTTAQTGTDSAEQQEQAGATGATEAAPESQPAQEAAAAPLEGQIVEQPEGTYAASELIGQSVISAEGENMGKIADLLVSGDNRIAGVMIGIGGFLGFGEKQIAVEIGQLTRAPGPDGAEQLVLNLSRAELEQAQEFVSLDEQRRQQQQEQAGATGEGQPASEGQSSEQALTQ